MALEMEQHHNGTAASSPVLIPLHNDFTTSSQLPEWAMIELNGELTAPLTTAPDKENPTTTTAAADSLLDKDQVELGSVRFVDDVSINNEWKPEIFGVMTMFNLDDSTVLLTRHAPLSRLAQKPVMILGTHELQGKIESLKQPFCVLEKEEGAVDGGGTSYRVGGIVTQKLLFDKYPKVILR